MLLGTKKKHAIVEKPKCPSTGHQRNKLWVTHTAYVWHVFMNSDGAISRTHPGLKQVN